MANLAEANLPDFFEFIRNGMSVKQSKECDGLPVTRIETIANGEIDTDRFGYAGLNKSENAKWLLKRGDILFSHINSVEHIGKCALFDMDMDVVHGMNLLCFRPNFDRAEPRYIKWLFRSPQFRSLIMPFVNKAVNQASISIGNLNNIRIKVPPLEEQKRIATILDQADDIRRKRQHAIERLNQLGQAIFHEMFGDPISPKNGLPLKNLGSVCAVSSGSTPSRAIPDYYKGNIPWVKTGEVIGKRILDTEEKITESAVKNSSLKIYKIGTILIAMYGQGKTRGNVGILDTEAATNQACAALSCSADIIPDFLFYQLKIGYEMIRSLGRGGNQPNLNAALVRNIPVIVPPREAQRNFVSRVLLAEAATETVNYQIDRMNNLFASLQHRAFAGEL